MSSGSIVFRVVTFLFYNSYQNVIVFLVPLKEQSRYLWKCRNHLSVTFILSPFINTQMINTHIVYIASHEESLSDCP